MVVEDGGNAGQQGGYDQPVGQGGYWQCATTSSTQQGVTDKLPARRTQASTARL